MALFHHRDQPPEQLRARLPRGERVISWADATDGSVVLATLRGLWWPAAAAGEHRLIGWQYVTKATWQGHVLTVIEAEVIDDVLLHDREPVALALGTPRDLPPTVRKRVEANIARSELVKVGGGAARFVARRVPGRDGLTWWARLEPGTPETADTLAAVRARLAILRAEWEEQRPR
jgi:hypothetical protein